MKEKEVKLCNVEFKEFSNESGIPQIRIEVTLKGIESGKVDTYSYWLSAFRWYSFQVSGTNNGQGDYGATPVFGLDTLGTIIQKGPSNLNQEHTRKFIIEATALDAVSEFFSVTGGAYTYFNLKKPHYDSFFNKNEDWDKFIDAVYDHVS